MSTYFVPWLQDTSGPVSRAERSVPSSFLLLGEHASMIVTLALIKVSVCGGDSVVTEVIPEKPAAWRVVCYFQEVISC